VAAIQADLDLLPGYPSLAPAGGDAVEPDLAQDKQVPQRCEGKQHDTE
jgi:hypothetical protein